VLCAKSWYASAALPDLACSDPRRRRYSPPIGPLFGERRRAEAHFHPADAAVRILPRGRQVAKILVARDRPAAERPAIDRVGECCGFFRLDAGGDEIAHRFYCLLLSPKAILTSRRGATSAVEVRGIQLA
jgi:hypothetical protein